MYDSVTHNFDRVSGLHDNGLTPSLRQEGDQSTEATIPENAIDDNAIDIRKMYHPWSSDTNDMNDIDQMTHYQSMQDIRHKICKDTPLKTDINKPYMDNIEAYDRDRHLLVVSLSDRLDLGAQQVSTAIKHTDQISEFPEHLNRVRLGEEMGNISQSIADSNISLIPQVDGIVDSRGSPDKTPVSLDLMESPVRYTNTQKTKTKY